LPVKPVQGATPKVYLGASHGLYSTHNNQLDTDLRAFIWE